MLTIKGGVYCYINLLNDKLYIGSTIDLSRRHIEHVKGKASCITLQNAVKKYGWNNFAYSLLEEVLNENQLVEREDYWIQQYDFDNLYNILPYAYSCLGVKRSKETKERMSDANPNKRMVAQYSTVDGSLINTFSALQKAARETNLDTSNIQKACSKSGWTCGGFFWRYVEDEVLENIPDRKVVQSTKRRPIAQLDINTNEIIKVFDSGRQIEREIIGCYSNSVKQVCKGRLQTHNGFRWMYYE